MSRDFILVLAGGLVALVTTGVVVLVMNWYYQREQVSRPDKAADRSAGRAQVASGDPLRPDGLAFAERPQTGSTAAIPRAALSFEARPAEKHSESENVARAARDSTAKAEASSSVDGRTKAIEPAPTAQLDVNSSERRAIADALAASAKRTSQESISTVADLQAAKEGTSVVPSHSEPAQVQQPNELPSHETKHATDERSTSRSVESVRVEAKPIPHESPAVVSATGSIASAPAVPADAGIGKRAASEAQPRADESVGASPAPAVMSSPVGAQVAAAQIVSPAPPITAEAKQTGPSTVASDEPSPAVVSTGHSPALAPSSKSIERPAEPAVQQSASGIEEPQERPTVTLVPAEKTSSAKEAISSTASGSPAVESAKETESISERSEGAPAFGSSRAEAHAAPPGSSTKLADSDESSAPKPDERKGAERGKPEHHDKREARHHLPPPENIKGRSKVK